MPFEDFLSYVKFEKRYSNHTLASYETDLNQFASFMESMSKQMQNAGPRDIRLWIAGLSDNHAPSTVNRKLSTIKSFYKFLLKTERIKSNPAKDLTNLKAPQRTPQFIDEKELLHLFEQLPIADDFKSARNLLIFDLFYATGMRKSELIALKHTDLDESSKSVKVLGKGKKERKIPVDRFVFSKINKYLKFRNEQFISIKRHEVRATANDVMWKSVGLSIFSCGLRIIQNGKNQIRNHSLNLNGTSRNPIIFLKSQLQPSSTFTICKNRHVFRNIHHLLDGSFTVRLLVSDNDSPFVVL